MKTLLALAALSLAFAAPARAEFSYASAETLGLGFELIDLNNMDGITPVISFSYNGNASQSYQLSDPRATPVSGSQSGYGVLENDIWGASVRVEAGRDLVKASATSWWAAVKSDGRVNTHVGFDLTPHTAVIFRVPYKLYASTSELGSMATASLLFTGTLGGGYDTFSLSDDQFWTGSKNDSFTGELASGSAGLQGQIGLTAHTVAAVVPEPGTYAMLLTGLGVLGAIGMRGRGQG